MFRIHSSTSMGSRTNENDCFYWCCVEHTLALPLFYITLTNLLRADSDTAQFKIQSHAQIWKATDPIQ